MRYFKKSNRRLENIDGAIDYINQLWPQLKKHQSEDTATLIGLKHPYIVPSISSGEFEFLEQYYWDSYFTSLGLDDEQLVTGMLDNLIDLFERFGLVPNASRFYMTSRSHPPLLTTFIFLVYDRFGKGEQWLKKRISVAKAEYESVWLHDSHPKWHNVHLGLSRYYDINMLHDLAEAESGWDMTPRFQRKCLDFLPIDLNTLLYKYEADFARAAAIVGDKDEEQHWLATASARAETINQLMWGKLRGFYFDYNYNKQTLGDVWSLAGFYPMWAGMVTNEQAARMVDNLKKFERKGGLSTTSGLFMYPQLFGSLRTQWAFPNGWAPLHAIVLDGLERYGYREDAMRIGRKWLKNNLDWYNKNGVFLEKYNVVQPEKEPIEGLYPSQAGFGWTNGVFIYLAKRYG